MTPGPWISIENDDGSWSILHEGKSVTELEANAHAMAAVPEMFQALCDLLYWKNEREEPSEETWNRAAEAVALAKTGRGAFWK